jgi:hypothetical protein
MALIVMQSFQARDFHVPVIAFVVAAIQISAAILLGLAGVLSLRQSQHAKHFAIAAATVFLINLPLTACALFTMFTLNR